MKIRYTVAFSVLILINVSLATILTTVYHSAESLADYQSVALYKRVISWQLGIKTRISVLLCALICAHHDNCKSVYVDGEACVFGVDDVTAFEEGEVVTPDPSQGLKLKGRSLYIN